jgi:RNA polymerase sigma-70 factor, ECF subfamily
MLDHPDRAFIDAVEPLRRALRVHCYRMLGSSHDSDDVVQETFLRAWRSRSTLKDPALLRGWLYRIATNVCLDELERRPRRALAFELHPAAVDPAAMPAAPIDEPVWLEPMPSSWLGGADDPASTYTLKESVALAFVAALQILSPPQRAVLLLRDVVGLSAEETAGALEMSVSAVTSALFRARTAVEQKLGGRDSNAFAGATGEIDRALLARYVRAFEEPNVDALVALLRDDVKTTMPPSPTWIQGLDANAAFFRFMFAGRFHRPGAVRAIEISANGQPAFAFYRRDEGGPLQLRAIQVVGVVGGAIATIDHFMLPSIFPLFEVPDVMSA